MPQRSHRTPPLSGWAMAHWRRNIWQNKRWGSLNCENIGQRWIHGLPLWPRIPWSWTRQSWPSNPSPLLPWSSLFFSHRSSMNRPRVAPWVLYRSNGTCGHSADRPHNAALRLWHHNWAVRDVLLARKLLPSDETVIRPNGAYLTFKTNW